MAKLDDVPPEVAPRAIQNSLDEVRDLRIFVNTAKLGTLLTASHSTFRELFARVQLDIASIFPNETAETWDELEEHARGEVEDDVPYIHGFATIRLASILETMVSDVCLQLLMDDASVLAGEQIRKLRGPIADFLRASEFERGEYLLELLSQETKAKLRPGAGRFEPLLQAVGLGGEVTPDGARLLVELTEVRNVLVHRRGLADKRLVDRCPWLNLQAGEATKVTGWMFARYMSAAKYYTIEIWYRWAVKHGDPALAEHVATFRSTVLDELKLAREPKRPN